MGKRSAGFGVLLCALFGLTSMMGGSSSGIPPSLASIGRGVDVLLGPARILTSLVGYWMSEDESRSSSAISSSVKDWCGAIVTLTTGVFGEVAILGGLCALKFKARSCLEGVLQPLSLVLSPPTRLPEEIGEGRMSLISAEACLPSSMLVLDATLSLLCLWLWVWFWLWLWACA